MKRLLGILLILTFLLTLPAGSMAHTEDEPFVTDLIAGGGNVNSQIDAGDVSVWNDEENLYVKYETHEFWCLLETHLHVGDELADIPQTKSHSPKVGHFAYGDYFSLDPCVTEVTYTILLEDVGLEYLEDAYIAAHAVVVDLSSETTAVVVSREGVDAHGPVYAYYPPYDTAWGTAGSAVATYTSPGWPYPVPDDGALYIATAYWAEDPVNQSWRWIQDEIMLPEKGYYLASGTVEASADDGEDVYHNGMFIGSDGGWNTVVAYPFTPQKGLNTFDFVFMNIQFPEGSTPAQNPTGLIYKISSTYYVEETGWGAGERFNDRNWSMYIVYNVQEPVIPSPGEDIVVFNDINPFVNTGMENPNNPLMVANLVDFTNPNPRGSGTVVWFDRGRNSKCVETSHCNDSDLVTMSSVITGLGYTLVEINSTSGSITTIPADVKIIFLWNPLVPYTTDEINAFKAFADEGGRLVFIGEWDGYYGPGIALENQFLLDMGAVMTNIGLAVDCGYNDLPAASLREHQITTGMDGVRIACASVIVPGPDDYPFMYDSTNTLVLAGVAKIDTTPLLLEEGLLQEPLQSITVEEGLNPNSSTGY